jgi:tRNA(Ile2) C34 agmatinyltransferase TiaS
VLEDKIHETEDLDEAAKIIKTGKGIVRAGWCSDEACAEKIEKMDITILGLFEEEATTDCIVCKGQTKVKVQMGKSY